jgi:hypothetical protein
LALRLSDQLGGADGRWQAHWRLNHMRLGQ